ncbi:hypothetical protein HDU97_010005 [Phlyctochytrium planicorne]|nr:hypothetical protein HDU97_010005 [Phlyctochytrium planicorne]
MGESGPSTPAESIGAMADAGECMPRLALPAIGIRERGFDASKATDVAVKSLGDFFGGIPEKKFEVVVVDDRDEVLDMYRKAFEGEPRLVVVKGSSVSRMRSDFGVDCSAVVVEMSMYGRPHKMMFSKDLYERGGDGLMKALKRSMRVPACVGKVLNAVTPFGNAKNAIGELEDCYERVLKAFEGTLMAGEKVLRSSRALGSSKGVLKSGKEVVGVEVAAKDSFPCEWDFSFENFLVSGLNFFVLVKSGVKPIQDENAAVQSGDVVSKMVDPYEGNMALYKYVDAPEQHGSEVIEHDHEIVIVSDKFPKAMLHFLILPRVKIASILSLRRNHLWILERMKQRAEALVKRYVVFERIGFHAVPSMKQVHLHVISEDFVGVGLRRKEHWNSFHPPCLLSCDEVMERIRKDGRIDRKDLAYHKELLKRPLVCHKCEEGFASMPDLKVHLKSSHLATGSITSNMSSSDVVVSKTVAIAAATIVSLPLAFIAYLHSISRKPYAIDAPFPPPAPILGTFYEIVTNYDNRWETFTRWAENHGPTWTIASIGFPRFPRILSVDPAVVEYILKTNFDNYVKGVHEEEGVKKELSILIGDRLHRVLEPLLGDGIFNTDGHQRKVSSHIFTGKNFRVVIERAIHDDVTKLVEVLSKAADSQAEIDLHLFLHCFTMDTFGQIGFGIQLNSLENPSDPPAFAKSFDVVLNILNRRFSTPLYPYVEAINGTKKVLTKNLAIINDFVATRINEKRAAIAAKSGVEAVGSHKDLLDLYLEYDAEITDKQLRDMVLNMMLAGRDTTAQALSWTFWLLTQYPDVVQRIREEVSVVLGDRIPLFDEVNLLKYTTAVFFETLRLYPSVPGDFKCSVKADVLPGGIAIPAGTRVNWITYSMGRMENIWGPDAKEFKPDRWLDGSGNIKRENPFKWVVFNAGPRVCLGQQMATVEAVMAIAALVPKFDFRMARGAKVVHGSSLTLVMKTGLKMNVLHAM